MADLLGHQMEAVAAEQKIILRQPLGQGEAQMGDGVFLFVGEFVEHRGAAGKSPPDLVCGDAGKPAGARDDILVADFAVAGFLENFRGNRLLLAEHAAEQ